MFDANYLAIVVAAIVSMAIGAFWFSPAFLGKAWMKEMGLTPEKMKNMSSSAGKGYAIMAVGQLVMAYVLSYFLAMGEASLFGAGAMMAFWLWLGFVAPLQSGAVAWEGKSWKLVFINASYWLVTMIIMGGIIAIW